MYSGRASTVRHGHDDAVGEAVRPIGVARTAFDLIHDGYEINQTPYRFHMLFYPLCADAILEVEPCDVSCCHDAFAG